MLRPDLTSWRAQYERMLRGAKKLSGEYRSSVVYEDDLQHFFQDCWHLKDWIKNDQPANARDCIEKEVENCAPLQVVADLANASKHMRRTGKKASRPDAYVTSNDVTVYIAQNRAADITYYITMGSGDKITAQEVVRDALQAWEELLRRLGLLS